MSQFLALVREGKVEKVTLTEREIQGIAQAGRAADAPARARATALRTLLGTEDEARPSFTHHPHPRPWTTTRLVTELETAQGRVRRPHRDHVLARSPLRLGAPARRSWPRIWIFLMRRMGGGPDPGPVLRPLQGQDLRPQGAQDHLRGRGRRGRGQGRAGRGGRLPEEPQEVPAPRRPHPQGRAPGRARRAPARRCWPARWRARPTCRSSSCPARSSWRCSWAWAPPACATSSSRPRRRRPASSSSTSWTPSARRARAPPASWRATTSASRR